MAMMFIQYPGETTTVSKAIVANKQKIWLPWLIMVAIAIWVLVSVFG
jgi:hypothetical protein